MKTLIKLLYILTPREQKLAIVLLTMILIMAFLDMLGVASIMPFIAILTNPDIIRNNILLNNIFEMTAIVGVQNDQQFIFILGIFVFLLLVFSLSFKALTIYLLIRFSAMREYTLGKRLVAGFLSQPYSWFLNRHSADLGKTILSEVSLVISHGIRPVMNLITFSAVTSMIIILLIVVDPKLSAIVGFTLVGSYGIIYAITRNFIKRIGYERLKANEELYKTITETFSAAKEIKVGGLEKEFTSRFSDPAKISAQHAASSQIISNLPRFFLEAIGFGGMILVILYLISINGTFLEALPIISLYAFAGYRLMPAIQQIYISLNQLRYVGSSLDDLYSDMKSFQPLILSKENKPLKLKESISLSHIHFSYPNSSKTTLKDINIKIPACNTIGLVGATGSGKTTLVDIILGLYDAQQGTLKVDDQIIDNQNKRDWQRSIGYVPQQIFLSDDTVASNIAFGMDTKDINQEAVKDAAKIANLHNFVNDELPGKYQTTIGERGVRLSGGQRQRIGIARALYHKPKVLVLDEATSALDNLTEQVVMDAVHNLSKKITIIMIAHRLSTVKKCDKIFLLSNGVVKSQGTFEELTKISKYFRSATSNL